MNQLLLPLLSRSAPGYSAQQRVLNFYSVAKKEEKEEEEEENNQRKGLCVLSVFYIDVHIQPLNVEQYKNKTKCLHFKLESNLVWTSDSSQVTLLFFSLHLMSNSYLPQHLRFTQLFLLLLLLLAGHHSSHYFLTQILE